MTTLWASYSRLSVLVTVDCEGGSKAHKLQDQRYKPGIEMCCRGRGFGVQQGDKEQRIDEEGGNDVNLMYGN